MSNRSVFDYISHQGFPTHDYDFNHAPLLNSLKNTGSVSMLLLLKAVIHLISVSAYTVNPISPLDTSKHESLASTIETPFNSVGQAAKLVRSCYRISLFRLAAGYDQQHHGTRDRFPFLLM